MVCLKILKRLFLATWEVESGRIEIWGQPGQKVCKIPSQPMSGHGSMHLSFQLHKEAQIGGLQCRLARAESKTLSPKYNSKKGWQGGSSITSSSTQTHTNTDYFTSKLAFLFSVISICSTEELTSFFQISPWLFFFFFFKTWW
jgi:hypothetical protein